MQDSKLEPKTTFKTIQNETNHILEQQKSKFIAQTHKINSKKQIKEILKQLKKENPKSNHIPYAFRIGEKNVEIGYSDDGEPTGCAGKPIYFEIKGKKITNTLITVVRYFGGIKLGTGGLTKAFSESSKFALEKTQIITKPITIKKTIEFQYEKIKEIEKFCEKNKIEITNKKYLKNCEFKIQIPIKNQKEILNSFERLLNL